MKCVVFVFAFAMVLTLTARGQTSDSPRAAGSRMILKGTLYDINGSVIVRGRMVAHRLGENDKEDEATTSDEGAYKLELPLDVYRIAAVAPGFCRTQLDRFRIVNSTFGSMSLDLVLEVSDNQPGCKHEIMIKKASKTRRPGLTNIAESR